GYESSNEHKERKTEAELTPMPPIVCSIENAFLLVFVVLLVVVVVEPAIGRIWIRVVGALQRIALAKVDIGAGYTSVSNRDEQVGQELEVVRSLIDPDRFERDFIHSRSWLDLSPAMQKCRDGLPHAVKSFTQEADVNRGMVLVCVVAS